MDLLGVWEVLSPGAESLSPHGGHVVSRNGPREVAPTPSGVQRRAHRDIGVYGSRAIARLDKRKYGVVTAAKCRSTCIRLPARVAHVRGGLVRTDQDLRAVSWVGLSWVWPGEGLSTSRSYTPWAAPHPSQSSGTAEGSCACTCRPSAGPGLHQVARLCHIDALVVATPATTHLPIALEAIPALPVDVALRRQVFLTNRARPSGQLSGPLPMRIPS